MSFSLTLSPLLETISVKLINLLLSLYQVQWDEPASISRPDRVSPWEIEPCVASVPANLSQPVQPKTKRPRPPIEIPTFGN